MPAQDLGYHQRAIHNDGLARANTYFVDDHPKGVAIGLPGRPIAF